MSFILVLRNSKTGTSCIWQGTQLRYVLDKANSYAARTSNQWTDAADTFLLENYPSQGPQPLVRPLMKIMGRSNVTPNAVIGRYHRLKRRGRV